MSVKVNWENKTVRNLYFSDLQVNQCFRNINGRGAVYRKVMLNNDITVRDKYLASNVYLMMEEATGRLFMPTTSQVEVVQVEVTVKAPKPHIYS